MTPKKKFSHNGNGNTRQVCGQVAQVCACLCVPNKTKQLFI